MWEELVASLRIPLGSSCSNEARRALFVRRQVCMKAADVSFAMHVLSMDPKDIFCA
jgi:hypothetical protein